MVNDVGAAFYFKPDAGQLLVSPADAAPSPPSDVQADEYELALGIDRLERATSISVRKINHKWAGLRTFARDGNPVVGEDPLRRGFFWLAGQGGYGFKTAPALSRIIAGLILTGALPADATDRGLTAEEMSPGRFSALVDPQLEGNSPMTIKHFDSGPRLSRMVTYGGIAYLAGLTADDTSAGVQGQTAQILAKIDGYLAQAGTSKSKILTAQIWLPDISTFGEMNAAWEAWIDPKAPPARATVESRLAGPQYKVEIMVTRPSEAAIGKQPHGSPPDPRRRTARPHRAR